jgi:hypothetical protein
MFVLVVTEPDQPMIAPRAIGPFDGWDTAQAFSQTLIETWQATKDDVPVATVTRVEEALPGVVVGEI